jgi:hypothetical protein
LQNKQDKFINDINAVKEQIEKLNSEIATLSQDNSYEIVRLEEGLADERDALYEI